MTVWELKKRIDSFAMNDTYMRDHKAVRNYEVMVDSVFAQPLADVCIVVEDGVLWLEGGQSSGNGGDWDDGGSGKEAAMAATGDECFEGIEQDARGMSKGEWISTAERLPEQDGRYLAVFENKKGRRWVGIHTFADGNWIKYAAGTTPRVICWQPIPDMPTEKGGDE